MKEAAGEANITVITIVLIGVVAAVGLTMIPRLMGNAKAKACCTDMGWYISGTMCCNPAISGCTDKNQRKSIADIRKLEKNTNSSIFAACMRGE